MKRRITDEERALFKKHIDEARPLKAVAAKPKTRRSVSGKSGGLDGNTAEKLRRGQLAPGARIDLHGMTEAAAHGALLSFLAGAQARGVRLALVITGIGSPASQEDAAWMRSPHGVLKERVPRWLNEREFAALSVGSGPAHRRHGGDGALYVYLRKKQ
jgi:DNA-nicking Smr family endonuclease